MDEVQRDEWLAGGAVFATGERAYGLDESGRSFCMGERDAVKAAMIGGEIDARLGATSGPSRNCRTSTG